MKLTTRQLTLCALLTAMALALSYMEGFLPILPLPGANAPSPILPQMPGKG